MRRAFKMLGYEVKYIHHAAYILGTFTLLSSLLAFLRDRLLAHTFGAGIDLDIYYAAFRLPDFIFVAIASLVSAYILIPELLRRNNDERAYIETITAGFFLGIAVVGVVAYALAPFLLSILFPSLASAGYLEDLVPMTRILLLQPILLGFSNILAAIMQVKSRYILYAIAPLLYNIGIMFGIVALYPLFGLAGLAWGVVLGAALHVGVQIPSVVRDGFFWTLPKIHDLKALTRTILLSLPRTLALSMNQIVLLVFVSIAGLMTVGSISVFTFAFNLQAVPLAVIGASYSVAAFPMLSRMFSEGAHTEFIGQIKTAARHIIFWSVPVIGLSVVLRAHLVRTILGSGAFDWTDTRLTAAAFALLILSLTAHALTLLVVRGYYAAGKSLVPLITQSFSALLAIALGYIGFVYLPAGALLFLESLLRVEGVPGTAVLVLPLAYSVAVIGSTAVLLVWFERHFKGFLSGIGRVLSEGIAASGIGGAVSYAVLLLLGGISSATTFSSVFLHGFLAGVAGILAVFITLTLLGSRELSETVRAFKRRVWEALPVASAEEEV